MKKLHQSKSTLLRFDSWIFAWLDQVNFFSTQVSCNRIVSVDKQKFNGASNLENTLSWIYTYVWIKAWDFARFITTNDLHGRYEFQYTLLLLNDESYTSQEQLAD